MFKGKKWLIGFCAMLLAFGIASCSDSEASSSSTADSSVTSSQDTPVTQPTITLSTETMSLNLFEKETLTATLKDLTGDTIWTTSNAGIAAVENGVVHALGVGTATITATVGEYSAACEVTVARGELTPEFDVLGDDISVMKNVEYTLDASMSIAGEEFTLATITFKTEGSCVSVDENGKLTALAYGTQDVTVTAVYGEVKVERTFSVTVYRRAAISTGIAMNRLELAITNYDWDMLTEYSLANVKAEVNGEYVDNAISYETADPTVVAVEEGKIVAKGKGETTVTAKFTDEAGVVSVPIFVTVVKEAITREVGFEALASGGLKAATGTVSLELSPSEMEIAFSEVTGVFIGETSYDFSVTDNVLKVQKVPGGYHSFTLQTNRVDVTVDGLVYMGAISTKAELFDYATNMNVYYGYAILTKDIDMEGAKWTTGDAWQRGTLDGMGHTVSNIITEHGFVRYQSELGTVKNIQLVNILLKPDVTFVRKNRIGFFGEQLCGAWEDMLVIGKIEGATNEQALAMGCVYQTSTVMKNIIIVANTDNSSVLHTGSGYQHTDGTGALVENVYYVCNTEKDMITCAAKAQQDNSKAYKTIAELLENEAFVGFDGWTVAKGVLPYMNSYADRQKDFATKFEGELKVDGTLTVNTTLSDGVITLKDDPDGITLDGTTLTLTAKGVYTIVVTSAEDSSVCKEYQLRLVDSETITYGGKYVLTDGANTTLDLSKLSKNVSVTAVTVNNSEVAYSVTGNILTFTNNAVDKQTIVLFDQTALRNYTVEVLVADYAATDLASYKAFWKTDDIYLNSKYMVIAADIDCGLSWIENSKAKFLASVIDGLGHTIKNQQTSYGVFGGINMANITVKNVTFESFAAADFYNGRLLGRYCQSMVYENVHFKNFTIPDHFFTSNQACLFMWGNGDGYWKAGAFVLKMANCSFELKCNDVYVDKTFFLVDTPNAYVSIFTNVTVTYNGTIATYDSSNTTNAKYENGQVPVTKFSNLVINDKTGKTTYNN